MIVRSVFLSFVALAAFGAWSSAIAAEPSAREIMQKMFEARRGKPDSSFRRMRLTTCKFGVKKTKTVCIKRPGIQRLELATLHTGKDSKSIAIVLELARERGLGLLFWAYDDGAKETDVWSYVAALSEVRRIRAAPDAIRASAMFFNSEISIEDMSAVGLNDFTYSVVEQREYEGRPVYVIDAHAASARQRKRQRQKYRIWVDAERFLALKAIFYDTRGKPVRRLSAVKLAQVDGVWVTKSFTMTNIETQRITKMQLETVAFGVPINSAFLSQRALSDRAFREAQLNKLRRKAK